MSWSYIGNIFVSMFRYLIILIDWIVYTCIRVFYNLFDAISQIRIFAGNSLDDSSLIGEISGRIYALIGVYALFKIVFVLINMMINPSDGSKGEKNIGSLVTRIFVSLALMMVVPFIFDKAYQLQYAIVDDNVIGQIIYPTDSTFDSGDVGQNVSNQLFSSFVTIDEDAAEIENLKYDDLTKIDPNTFLKPEAKDKCANSLSALLELYHSSQADNIVSTNAGVSTLFPVINDRYKKSDTGNEEFCIHYNFLISTIAGGFAAYILAIYCIDVGLRVAKLAFYELIAPIPIVSYIDGKKNGPFYKWLKDSAVAYADIFIRLVIINFVFVLVVQGVPSLLKMSVITDHDIVTQFFAKAAVILGLLMFAMQAPKLICDMFGIDSNGGAFSINPRTKLDKLPKPVNQALSVGAGAVAGAIGGAAATAGTLAGGAVTGTVGGLFAKRGEKGKTIKENIGNTLNNTRMRGKGALTETVARLQPKNYNDKGVYNRSVSGRDLALQARTGDVNRTGGLGGVLTGWQNNLTSSLMFQSSQNKPAGLRKVGAISANLDITRRNLQAERFGIEQKIKSGDASAVNELKIDPGFNAKSKFEDVLNTKLKEIGVDSNFQSLPKSTDTTNWDKIEEAFMAAANQKDGLTQAEKEALRDYAEKALGDLKTQVDTQTKNKG